MMIKVLLPVDGSKPSERAVRHVIDLAKAGIRVEAFLLTVLPEGSRPRSRTRRRLQALSDFDATVDAMRTAAALLEGASLSYGRYTRVGAPADTILKFSKKRHCDLIVMGTRGLGAVAGLVFGSVAMKVLQLAEIPVTFVK